MDIYQIRNWKNEPTGIEVEGLVSARAAAERYFAAQGGVDQVQIFHVDSRHGQNFTQWGWSSWWDDLPGSPKEADNEAADSIEDEQ